VGQLWTNPAATANLVERKNVFPQGARKGRKGKSRPRRACKDDAFGHKTSSIENRIFIHSKVNLERAVGSAHFRNIRQ